jgi:hypothetical protein
MYGRTELCRMFHTQSNSVIAGQSAKRVFA